MTQAATFGRRGTVAPPPTRPNPPRDTAKAPASAPRAGQAPLPTSKSQAAPKARPKSGDDSLFGYFMWLLFSFDGRLDRRTYRYCRIVANLGYLVTVWSLNAAILKATGGPGMVLLLSLISLSLSIVMIWSTLAMQVKRRHDRDKAWPWLFVGFIPVIGPLWVLVECCWLEGTPGYNRFDDPAKTAAAVFA